MIEHMIEWAPVPFLLSGEWSDFLGFVMSGLFIAASRTARQSGRLCRTLAINP